MNKLKARDCSIGLSGKFRISLAARYMTPKKDRNSLNGAGDQLKKRINHRFLPSVHRLQEYIQERQKHFSNNVAKIPGIITDKSRYTMTSEALSPNQQ
ncbi:hypothetical protein DTO282E5_3942 [Paecilomyces variotii]|nr:hypothetical protein DTO027B9_5005 [Paecilomyces variotii]KAJ9371335.1 hypothetical protein DTO282E5_3942 [Paecilomyces variotii]